MTRKVAFLVLAFVCSLFAQATRTYEIEKIVFVGNRFLPDEQLRSILTLRETPAGLWKFIYRNVSEAVGQKPEFFDPVNFTSDYQRLKQFYERRGFFTATIDTTIDFDTDEMTVTITYKINEGKRSYIDTLIYRGLDKLPSDVHSAIFKDPIVKVGDPYDLEQLENELRRIVSILANSGYINAKVVRVEAKRFASTNNFSVLYEFQPGDRYRFGAIHVVYDSTSNERISEGVILRHLDFSEGEYYSEEKKFQSERNLNRLGVFDISRIENMTSEQVLETHTVPVVVTVRTRSFQELAPEIGINDENNAFNISFGVAYSHRNLFGGAQNFTSSLRMSIQSIRDFRLKKFLSEDRLKDSSIIAKLDWSMQLVQPYFLNNKTSLRVAFTASVDKQRSYYLPVVRWQTGVTTQTAMYTKVFLDWNLEFSNPTALATRADTIIGLYERQLNSIFTFTIQRDKRNDVFYPSSGFFHSFTFEEAGLLPRTIGPFIKNTIPYSQYIKTVVFGYWYWDPTLRNKFIWAVKAKVGTAFLYGHAAANVPLTQRFFAGGSGSMRGWKARSLGVVQRRDLGGNALIEGTVEGRWNPLQEAGSFLFLDASKISFVGFYDIGNMWARPAEIRVSQLSMDIGIGIRYNTVAGPIRFDFGVRLYDPDLPQRYRWIHQRRFFPETVANGVFHLGVGHTF
ncbi:MAG: BamA/TamA family outer membrane protein [Bacteroidetes bacterium]|nr:BamA/TamA family outer membrane protein [Bacteroidota bacterium]